MTSPRRLFGSEPPDEINERMSADATHGPRRDALPRRARAMVGPSTVERL
jgi:hypothetical protein